jgi:hypothetical protein
MSSEDEETGLLKNQEAPSSPANLDRNTSKHVEIKAGLVDEGMSWSCIWAEIV